MIVHTSVSTIKQKPCRSLQSQAPPAEPVATGDDLHRVSQHQLTQRALEGCQVTLLHCVAIFIVYYRITNVVAMRLFIHFSCV